MRVDSMRVLLAAVILAAVAPADAQTRWVGTWGAAPSSDTAVAGTTEAKTLREIVHVSVGGETIRVTLTNELGTASLRVDGAHVAARAQGSSVQPGSDRTLLFGGQPSIVIPAGAVAVSDPITFHLAPLSDLSISLLLPAQYVQSVTVHSLGLQTLYEGSGDQTAAPEMTVTSTTESWRYLKNVEVEAEASQAAVVTLGDSITDGYKSTAETNRRWPDVLAARFQADKHLKGLAVLNEGISGNRILHNGAGPNALARFDRDVLSQDGVRYLIVLEGINDIGSTARPRTQGEAITADQLEVAYGQIIERAHAHGIKVFGATLTPFEGAGYFSPGGEMMREAVNQWIRTSGRFDGVIDFDKMTRDASRPAVFSPANDSGDHLHPGDAGYKNMGDAIDLRLFR